MASNPLHVGQQGPGKLFDHWFFKAHLVILLVPFPVPFGFGQGEGVGRDAETLGQHHAAMGRVVREKFHHQRFLNFFYGMGDIKDKSLRFLLVVSSILLPVLLCTCYSTLTHPLGPFVIDLNFRNTWNRPQLNVLQDFRMQCCHQHRMR